MLDGEDMFKGRPFTCRATGSGKYFSHWRGKVARGYIHSVFHRVVNFYLERDFLSLVGPGLGSAAAFINLDLPENIDFINLGLAPDMPVSLTGGWLWVNGILVVDCRRTCIWQGRERAELAWRGEELTWANLTALGQALSRWGRGGGWEERVADPLRQLRSGLLGRERDNLDGAVRSLLGYGPGLTPSGDDFLLGLLAVTGGGADYRVCLEGFHRAIAANLERTNEISAFFLRQALAGDYHEYLQEVVYAVINGIPATVITAARKLLALGATSGTDMARGIYLGFSWAVTGSEGAGTSHGGRTAS
ncbi:hypothetical protein MORE_12260 [Moorella thermoacetica]|nr:hypothetical protein MORE_12260 [Moorella thermoacetica]